MPQETIDLLSLFTQCELIFVFRSARFGFAGTVFRLARKSDPPVASHNFTIGLQEGNRFISLNRIADRAKRPDDVLIGPARVFETLSRRLLGHLCFLHRSSIVQVGKESSPNHIFVFPSYSISIVRFIDLSRHSFWPNFVLRFLFFACVFSKTIASHSYGKHTRHRLPPLHHYRQCLPTNPL